MRQFRGLIVSLIVCGAFLSFVSVFSKAQPTEKTITVTTVESTKVEADPVEETTVEEKKELAKPESRKAAMKVKVVVEKAAERAAPVADNEPNPQLLQQYRPMVWAEYYLVKSVCDPTLEQRKAIARDAEHAFQETIAKSALNGQLAGIRLRGIVRGAQANQKNEPENSIRMALAKTVTNHLKPEQIKKYEEELEKRAAHRKRICVDNITAKIDESLVLTADQREKIRKSLSSNWQEVWGSSPETMLFNQNLMPQVPDQFILPILNETQKSIWRGMTKFSAGSFGGFGFMINNVLGGDSPEDDILREAREAETEARTTAKAKRETDEKVEADANAKVKTTTKKN